MTGIFAADSLYMPLTGFLTALVCMLYFLSKFREACRAVSVTDSGFAADAAPAQPAADADKPAPEAVAAIESEISEFRVQLDEMKSLVDQRKNLHEKQIVDIISNINGIVSRLENVEPQYLEEIQPSLVHLVTELENIRAAGGSPAAAGRG